MLTAAKSLFFILAVIKGESKSETIVRVKPLLMTGSNFIFTIICAGVKQLKRQIAKSFGINHDAPPNSCASSRFVAESEKECFMGVNHTFGKFLYLDTALTQRQPAHTRPRQFAVRTGERKI